MKGTGEKRKISKLRERVSDITRTSGPPERTGGSKAPATFDITSIPGAHKGIVGESAQARKELASLDVADPANQARLAELRNKIAELMPVAKQVRDARLAAGVNVLGGAGRPQGTPKMGPMSQRAGLNALEDRLGDPPRSKADVSPPPGGDYSAQVPPRSVMPRPGPPSGPGRPMPLPKPNNAGMIESAYERFKKKGKGSERNPGALSIPGRKRPF